jgi:hypothetical protein
MYGSLTNAPLFVALPYDLLLQRIGTRCFKIEKLFVVRKYELTLTACWNYSKLRFIFHMSRRVLIYLTTIICHFPPLLRASVGGRSSWLR